MKLNPDSATESLQASIGCNRLRLLKCKCRTTKTIDRFHGIQNGKREKVEAIETNSLSAWTHLQQPIIVRWSKFAAWNVEFVQKIKKQNLKNENSILILTEIEKVSPWKQKKKTNGKETKNGKSKKVRFERLPFNTEWEMILWCLMAFVVCICGMSWVEIGCLRGNPKCEMIG